MLSLDLFSELDDTCLVHFRGTLPDGTEFANSDTRTIAEKGITVNKTAVAEEIKDLQSLKRQHVELEQYEEAREIKDQITALSRRVSTGSPAKPQRFIPSKVLPKPPIPLMHAISAIPLMHAREISTRESISTQNYCIE